MLRLSRGITLAGLSIGHMTAETKVPPMPRINNDDFSKHPSAVSRGLLNWKLAILSFGMPWVLSPHISAQESLSMPLSEASILTIGALKFGQTLEHYILCKWIIN